MNDVTIYSKSIPKPPSKLKHMLTAVLVILLLWGSSVPGDASLSKLVVGFSNMMDLFKEMVPSAWGYFLVFP
ncbi:phosphonate ABC transporter, permease protein PhnE, partial [Bacillus anthracis]|nr:phosphonate ABC transporter, permease protein PhnE [Bacillus anthracis]